MLAPWWLTTDYSTSIILPSNYSGFCRYTGNDTEFSRSTILDKLLMILELVTGLLGMVKAQASMKWWRQKGATEKWNLWKPHWSSWSAFYHWSKKPTATAAVETILDTSALQIVKSLLGTEPVSVPDVFLSGRLSGMPLHLFCSPREATPLPNVL